MKKIVIAIIAIVTLASCTQSKIGFVNSETVMKEYSEVSAVEAELKEQSDKRAKDFEKLGQDFQAKYMKFQAEAAKMSAKKRDQKMQELQTENQRLQQMQQQLQYQTQSDGQAAIKEIAEKVNTFIKDYGKKNGYQLILGTVDLNGAVMYGDEKIDLTKIVIKGLNDAYENKDTKTEETKTATPAKVEEVKTETKKEDAKK
ncbi:MAG TPA: OmpH family outer membrane protein [Flavobacteriaceae bacterium]|nr:OmpH family outer membrane protein [Flavobacteriaceae bacterium]